MNHTDDAHSTFARAPLSALRCRVRRDLKLYKKAQSTDVALAERKRIECLIQHRLPTRLAQLHAQEGNDSQEALEWTRLLHQQRPTEPPRMHPPPPIVARPAVQEQRLARVLALKHDVRDVLCMTEDLFSLTKEQNVASVNALSQSVSDSKHTVTLAARNHDAAAQSASNIRTRMFKMVCAVAGVAAAAVVCSGSLGTAAAYTAAAGVGAAAAWLG